MRHSIRFAQLVRHFSVAACYFKAWPKRQLLHRRAQVEPQERRLNPRRQISGRVDQQLRDPRMA
jgi:hypothetical protein